MTDPLLRTVTPAELPDLLRPAVTTETEIDSAWIVDGVRDGGEKALRHFAERFGDLQPGAPLLVERAALDDARRALDPDTRALLERTAARIRSFALAQRAALTNLEVPVPGGVAGHEAVPVERAGCYAPGGRFPLPSSVLMTAVVARAAGVGEVWVASPRPAPITLAAAAVAGVDGLLAVGGAHAVSALAYGVGGVPAVDVIVGPGNRWVTAAKKRVFGRVGIDMLAGPSELVVLADATADPATIAADLLAQAEHDPDALPVLVTIDASLAAAVNEELARQLTTLPTAETARAALTNGFVVLAPDLASAVACCNRLAPEHLEVMVADFGSCVPAPSCYGALFVGGAAAEVLGDYGAGPNHVLPTGGGARFGGGLSVLDFLRLRTHLRIDDPAAARPLVDDAVTLARLEGLEGHARAAEQRRRGGSPRSSPPWPTESAPRSGLG